MNAWIGTSGFQYPEWRGKFYPEKLPAAKMLPFYAERFSTTEINYSFRRIPSANTIENWSRLTPGRFSFSLKAPQKITHFARLRYCAATVDHFFSTVSALGAKLGPVLFQLPPNFEKDVARLREFLAVLPRGLKPAFEFRHASWFNDDTFDALRMSRAALCVAESESLTAPLAATADFGYLRLRREDYTDADIARWASKIGEHLGKWTDVFIYFKHEERGVGPEFAARMTKLLAAPRRNS
jgi:uncharacterized protein YecE (DUF72 family)